MSSKTLKQIAVDETNYKALKSLGQAGDSFNDAVTVALQKAGVIVATESVQEPPEGTPSSGDGRIRGTPSYLPKHEIRHPRPPSKE
jgi:hypothetical protein